MIENGLILSQEFSDCLDEMETGSGHLMITGKAGTGKSTLLDLFRRTTSKNIAILAPTGIAALRVKGQTIHSFFRFPPRLILPHDIDYKATIARVCKKLQILIIDEVSMVRADIMDGIDAMLRIHRKQDTPFGGVRLIVFGDLYQLPPIVSGIEEKQFFQNHYQTSYFFSSHIWQSLDNIQYIELQKVYRQRDRRFIQLLDEIRYGNADYDILNELNERVEADAEPIDGYIYLSTRNQAVNQINEQKLNNLADVAKTFQARITGNFSVSTAPTEQFLTLKEGAQVIFLRNDPDRQYVNGSLGIVEAFEPELIVVRLLENNQIIKVSRTVWEMVKYIIAPDNPNAITTEITGSFEQFPLKLAWAMTIHKSQGQTFDRVLLDMSGGAFESGQTYVALSRCRTLDGIILKKPLTPRDIILDERIVDFVRNFR